MGQLTKPQTSRDSKDRGAKDPVREREGTKEKELERKELVKDKDAQLKDKRTSVVIKENKAIPKDKSPQSRDKDRSPVQGTKMRKDSEQSEPDASNRRKTRSTATGMCFFQFSTMLFRVAYRSLLFCTLDFYD